VTSDRLRDWLPEGPVGLAVLFAGFVEVVNADVTGPVSLVTRLGVVVGIAAAVALSRRQPGGALALLWLTALYQVATGTPVMTVEFAVAVVAFGCARWGRPATVVLSGLSIPAAAGVGALLVSRGSYGFFRNVLALRELVSSAYRFSDTLLVGAVVLGLLLVTVPWLAGLVLRATARAERSEVRQEQAEADAARAIREREQAREIVDLRDQQVRMARDVHDVVGHSLAVILAQAESAQYLQDVDTQALKRTMTNIATTARTSLQDVRQVLSTTNGTATQLTRHGSLDSLVDGLRAAGHEVVATEVGTPQPLPPELDVVAFRVLQEMLTNAIKHGQRGQPILVERHWEGELRIEVRNVIDTTAPETQPLVLADPVPEHAGQGLDGMRRRLEAVGGRLDVRRRAEPGGPTFTATAWVPVRAAP
jgi:signal transduction histidine kinase